MSTRWGDIGRGAGSPGATLAALHTALIDARRVRFTGTLFVSWCEGQAVVESEGRAVYGQAPPLLWTEREARTLAAVRALGRVRVRIAVTKGVPGVPVLDTLPTCLL